MLRQADPPPGGRANEANEREQTVADHSRRVFLKRASIGTAAVGAAAVAPTLLGGGLAQADAAHAGTDSGPEHGESFVVLVENPKTGLVTILVNDRELSFHDKKLTKRLAQAAARAARS